MFSGYEHLHINQVSSDDNYPAFHDRFEGEPYNIEISEGVQMSTTELPVTKRNTCRFCYVQVSKRVK